MKTKKPELFQLLEAIGADRISSSWVHELYSTDDQMDEDGGEKEFEPKDGDYYEQLLAIESKVKQLKSGKDVDGIISSLFIYFIF